MNISVFSWINCEVTSIRQKILNEHGTTHKGTCYKEFILYLDTWFTCPHKV